MYGYTITTLLCFVDYIVWAAQLQYIIHIDFYQCYSFTTFFIHVTSLDMIVACSLASLLLDVSAQSLTSQWFGFWILFRFVDFRPHSVHHQADIIYPLLEEVDWIFLTNHSRLMHALEFYIISSSHFMHSFASSDFAGILCKDQTDVSILSCQQ